MIRSPSFWAMIQGFINERSCLMCSKRFADPWLRYEGAAGFVINGAVAFHWSDTHGIDPETLVYLFRRHLFADAGETVIN